MEFTTNIYTTNIYKKYIRKIYTNEDKGFMRFKFSKYTETVMNDKLSKFLINNKTHLIYIRTRLQPLTSLTENRQGLRDRNTQLSCELQQAPDDNDPR